MTTRTIQNLSKVRPQPKKRPRVVAFGGGTGMSVLLAGLKHQAHEVRAVVTVSDNGGSSGRLAKSFGVPPPGDFRNCLLAMAEIDPLLAKVLAYRFEEGDVSGHALGNLVLTALARVTGSFDSALEEAARLLGLPGRVYPATDRKVVLVATHSDGSRSSGETQIIASRKRIERVRLLPDAGRVHSEVVEIVRRADLIVLGPGSLYTSIIPNLLVGGMIEAIRDSGAPVVLVVNLMTQPGETDHYTAVDHLQAILDHSHPDLVDYCLVHEGLVPEKICLQYGSKGSSVVDVNAEALGERGVEILRAELAEVGEFVRHDSERLARAVLAPLDRTRSSS